MPKRGGEKRGNKSRGAHEEAENVVPLDEDFSTDESSAEQYKTLATPQKMDLQMETAYKIHEKIQLDWPSLTVCMQEEEGRVLIEQALPGDAPAILDLEVKMAHGSKKRLVSPVKKKAVPFQANRIRAGNGQIYAITDKSIHGYTADLKSTFSREIAGGYGLTLCRSSLFYGNGTMLACQPGADERQLAHVELGNGEIFSAAAISEREAFAGTRSVDLVDFRSGSAKRYMQLSCDVNSIAYNGENLIVVGDDAGILRLLDARSEGVVEEIEFHQSPVSHVQFGSRETFASASSCEIAMWDMTYEETEGWDYHKYLSFVHQGEAYYKDFEFINEDIIISTSENGLCIFSPQTQIEEPSHVE
ncbi:uncharacterized protein NEMAJ01_0900 [Nematocida major]|uniref:uncharacterized protein n=1 Tax=Nematocida major TaxID=1912982 RepID=UPI0020078B29|nr:uncharacterized protein NEMAJ01_0900 [Nematocida major]KAH9386004.1 hypothetical protein NEMAJ01_0900 [Nematocida major]